MSFSTHPTLWFDEIIGEERSKPSEPTSSAVNDVMDLPLAVRSTHNGK